MQPVGLTTEEVIESIQKTLDKFRVAYNYVKSSNLSSSDLVLKQILDKGARGMMGGLEGYAMEFEEFYKHRIKGREIVAAKSIADVVIGREGDPFAKAIQSKSTIQTADAAIDDYIEKALKQLSGTGGENPRPNDRPIILMTIWDPGNPWPYDRSANTLPNHNSLEQKVLSRIKTVIDTALQKSSQSGVITFDNENNSKKRHRDSGNEIHNFSQTFNINSGEHGELGLTQHSMKATPGSIFIANNANEWKQVKTLVIKIRWPLAIACTNNIFMSGYNIVATPNFSTAEVVRHNQRFIEHTTTGFNYSVGKRIVAPSNPRIIVNPALNINT